jgi:hypothetical protein
MSRVRKRRVSVVVAAAAAAMSFLFGGIGGAAVWDYVKGHSHAVAEFVSPGAPRGPLTNPPVDARNAPVSGDGVGVNMLVKTTSGPGNWQTSVDGSGRGEASWLIHYENLLPRQVDHVVVRVDLPSSLKVVHQSVALFTDNHQNGLRLSDSGLFGSSGVDVGSYTIGGDGYIRFSAMLAHASPPHCRSVAVIPTASVRADGVDPAEMGALYLIRAPSC